MRRRIGEWLVQQRVAPNSCSRAIYLQQVNTAQLLLYQLCQQHHQARRLLLLLQANLQAPDEVAPLEDSAECGANSSTKSQQQMCWLKGMQLCTAFNTALAKYT